MWNIKHLCQWLISILNLLPCRCVGHINKLKTKGVATHGLSTYAYKHTVANMHVRMQSAMYACITMCTAIWCLYTG